MSDADGGPRALSAEQRALVAGAVPLAQRLCAQFIRRTKAHYLADDLRAVSLQALHDGALAYNPALGIPFAVFVWRRVDGALLDALKRESKHWCKAREPAYDVAEAVEDTTDPFADTDDDATALLERMTRAVAAAPILGLVGHALRAQGEEGEILRARYKAVICAAEAALSALSEEERRVIWARQVERRTWQEVTAELGLPERTAKRRAVGACARFAAALRAQREPAQGGAISAG